MKVSKKKREEDVEDFRTPSSSPISLTPLLITCDIFARRARGFAKTLASFINHFKQSGGIINHSHNTKKVKTCFIPKKKS